VASRSFGRFGLTAALAAAPIAAAWRFAHAYRVRAGYPRRRHPTITPGDLGLAFEPVEIPSGDLRLPAWWIPAREGAPGPAVVIVHGWESARDSALPSAQFLHAAGYHVLAFDVRGHGDNEPEELPLTAGEFGADAAAAIRYSMSRSDVTATAVIGHSMGGVGALLAAAEEPRVAAVVAVSSPADPYRLTRLTFHLARLPLPDPIAYPLAWLTTRVFLAPRRHDVAAVSSTRAIATYPGPVLLVHGDHDAIVPLAHFRRLHAAADRAQRGRADRRAVETLLIAGGQHSWLYEFEAFRAGVTRFLASTLGGPLSPEDAADVARAVPATRLPAAELVFVSTEDEPGGLGMILKAIRHAGAVPQRFGELPEAQAVPGPKPEPATPPRA
jgi:pimeloyl-ACP methyl ester carboxylesterase